MKTLNEKLTFLRKQWKKEKNYDKPSIPEILKLNKEYRKINPNKYPYNQAIKDFINQEYKISEENQDILATEIYLSQQDIKKEIKNQEIKEMQKEGFNQFLFDKSIQIIEKAIQENKKIQIKGIISSDWLNNSINQVYKPMHINNIYGLQKPHARKSYYNPIHFIDCYYKLV